MGWRRSGGTVGWDRRGGAAPWMCGEVCVGGGEGGEMREACVRER